MGFKLIIGILSTFVIISSAFANRRELGEGDFDVTNSKYGGKADSDIAQALAKAWTDACAATTPSKIIIPSGTYQLKEAHFKGPCKAAIEMQVQGTIQAPKDCSNLEKPDTWVEFIGIDGLTLSGSGTFDGQGADAWKKNNCHEGKDCKPIPTINLRFTSVNNSVVKDITSLNSKNFHINVIGCNKFSFEHVTITAPGDSTNTDGIHVGRSTGINITDSKIGTGDDCISIGDGTKELTVTKVNCGPGHGISIGSLGKYQEEEPVAGINVRNCTLTGTTNGVRIKTWPSNPKSGSASDIHFEDIIMDNVENPIIIDQEYCPWNTCKKDTPSQIKISNVSFKNIKGTTKTPVAVKLACSKEQPCDKVEMNDIDIKFTGNAPGGLTSQCSNVQPTMGQVAAPLACAVKM